MCCSVLQCITVCHNVLQSIALCYSVLQCITVCSSVLQCVTVCCSALQCVTVCCDVLQCVAVCCHTCTQYSNSFAAARVYGQVSSVLQCVLQCVGTYAHNTWVICCSTVYARHRLQSCHTHPMSHVKHIQCVMSNTCMSRSIFTYSCMSLCVCLSCACMLVMHVYACDACHSLWCACDYVRVR